jgi:primosomal protein N' (replication factor Y)
MVAEVIINVTAKTLNKTFDYMIPKELEKETKIGSRVFVPFGTSKTMKEAFVISLKKESKYATKEIIKQEESGLTPRNIDLAKLMARRYFCNISDSLKLMLPPGNTTKNLDNRIKEKVGNFVYLKKDIEEIEIDIETRKIKK